LRGGEMQAGGDKRRGKESKLAPTAHGSSRARAPPGASPAGRLLAGRLDEEKKSELLSESKLS